MSPPQQQQVGKIAPRSFFEARVSVSSHPHSGLGHLKISPACQPMVAPPAPRDPVRPESDGTEPPERTMLCTFGRIGRRP
jgi:hypothetical protein